MQNAQKWALSFDTDWVPQFVLDYVFDILNVYNMPATFFCTSSYVFPSSDIFEKALHPNYLPHSTHGTTNDSCLTYVKNLYPHAIGHRSHCYYWHSGLEPLLINHGISYDSSCIMPFQSHLKVHSFYDIIRIPVWCGDNLLMRMFPKSKKFKPPHMDTPGLKVLNFHPIHIYLNSNDLSTVRALQSSFSLPHVSKKHLETYRRAGAGMELVFEDALKQMRNKSVFKLCELEV